MSSSPSHSGPAEPEERSPLVSVGLPIYNAEAFLDEAIESLLNQTVQDLELIISDNASTDRTEELCNRWAQRDARVRYFRNERNVGANPNFNRVVELARGKYFKWAAHDDKYHPEYIESCLHVLDKNPDIVLAFTRSVNIDTEGNTLEELESGLDVGREEVHRRFRELIRLDYPMHLIFGLMRTQTIKSMPLLRTYADCDRVLVCELGLKGRIAELSERYFYHRVHPNQSVSTTKHNRQLRSAWFRGDGVPFPAFPYTREWIGFAGAMVRNPMPGGDRMHCVKHLCWWLKKHRRRVWTDYSYALQYPFGGGKNARQQLKGS